MSRRRAALRAHVRALRARTEAAVGSDPRVQRARQRRRLKRVAAIALLLLLLLLIRCEGPAGPAPALAAADAGARIEKPVEKGPPPARVAKKIVIASKPVARPAFDPPARPPAEWVDEFRLQVAARSPRLAACFIGSNRPGALRWTTLVSLQTGAVGEHDFESMGVAADLTRGQLDCLQAVLSKPEYLLKDAPAGGLPERVSLVLEF
ncbi:MAG: hypothetical protein JNJ54_07525 [Myxococcaceae bacterium]|nr:hypothetical protein [Myxococcaceae bacterium]